MIKNGLRWRDAPPEYGPHKTIYNRFIRWSRLGAFSKIFAALAHKGGKVPARMVDLVLLETIREDTSVKSFVLFLKSGVDAVFSAGADLADVKALSAGERPSAAPSTGGCGR